jgi:hypothetical protein
MEFEELLERPEATLDWLADGPDEDTVPEWVDAYEL